MPHLSFLSSIFSSSWAPFVVCSHSWLIYDNSFSASSNFHLFNLCWHLPIWLSPCFLQSNWLNIFLSCSHFSGISKGVQFTIFNYNPFYLFSYKNKNEVGPIGTKRSKPKKWLVTDFSVKQFDKGWTEYEDN